MLVIAPNQLCHWIENTSQTMVQAHKQTIGKISEEKPKKLYSSNPCLKM